MTPDANTRPPYTPAVTPPIPPTPTPTPAPTSIPLVQRNPQTPSEEHVAGDRADSCSLGQAAQRLTRSRALLQNALAPPPVPHKSATTPPHQRAAGAAATPSGISSIPGLALGLEAAKFWWSRHPLHLVGTQLAKTAHIAVQPVAQRNPVALVAGAFLVGGLLAWARPWRLVLKPILFAGVMPQITSAVLAHFTAHAKNNAKH